MTSDDDAFVEVYGVTDDGKRITTVAALAQWIDEIIDGRQRALRARMIADGCTDMDSLEGGLERQFDLDMQWRERTLMQARALTYARPPGDVQ